MSSVRAGSIADLPAVEALERANLGPDAWSEALLRPGLAGELPTVHYLVAEVDDSVVGHAVVSVAGDIAELQRISVDPPHRRGGVATDLLERAVTLGAQQRADRMLLEVRADNDSALAFYGAREFVEVDRRARYYKDGATAVVMRRGLGRGCGGER